MIMVHASINSFCHCGFATQMGEDRPWLLKIHCVNHRIELVAKEATKTTNLKKA